MMKHGQGLEVHSGTLTSSTFGPFVLNHAWLRSDRLAPPTKFMLFVSLSRPGILASFSRPVFNLCYHSAAAVPKASAIQPRSLAPPGHNPASSLSFQQSFELFCIAQFVMPGCHSSHDCRIRTSWLVKCRDIPLFALPCCVSGTCYRCAACLSPSILYPRNKFTS
jgi:hypothetical protein